MNDVPIEFGDEGPDMVSKFTEFINVEIDSPVLASLTGI